VQRATLSAGWRDERSKSFAEVTEAEPSRRLALKQRPGGLLKSLSTTVTLEPTPNGTLATEEFQFEVSMGILAKP